MKQYLSAIIEDDPEYSRYLAECLERYGKEHGCGFQIRSFGRAEAFLESVQGLYDLVFMDVELGDGRDFARCSASVLVNLRYVDGLYGDEVSVGGTRIRIGRSRKKEFMTRLNEYLGG